MSDPGGVPASLEDVADRLEDFPAAFWSRFPCVYFLIKDGVVVYVGETGFLLERLAHHARQKAFDRILYMKVAPGEGLRIEGEFIRRLDPVLNRRAPMEPQEPGLLYIRGEIPLPEDLDEETTVGLIRARKIVARAQADRAERLREKRLHVRGG